MAAFTAREGTLGRVEFNQQLRAASPVSERGTVLEIAAMFVGAEKLRTAVDEMQALLYS